MCCSKEFREKEQKNMMGEGWNHSPFPPNMTRVNYLSFTFVYKKYKHSLIICKEIFSSFQIYSIDKEKIDRKWPANLDRQFRVLLKSVIRFSYDTIFHAHAFAHRV